MNRIAILNEFVDKNPMDLFSRHALALEYIKLGDDSKAIDIFTGILALDELYIGSYYHLGKAYERSTLINKALEVYQHGMDVAMKLKDHHAKRELMAAFSQLQDELDD